MNAPATWGNGQLQPAPAPGAMEWGSFWRGFGVAVLIFAAAEMWRNR